LVENSVNAKKPVKIKVIQDLEARIEQTTDVIVSPSTVPQIPVTYQNALNILAQVAIILPENYSYLDLAQFENLSNSKDINIHIFRETFAVCEHLDEVVGILKWYEQEDAKTLENLVVAIVQCCTHQKISNCKYLTDDLKLEVFEKFSYFNVEIRGVTYKVPYKTLKLNTLTMAERFTCIFNSKLLIASYGSRRKDIKIADMNFRYILSKADLFLKNTMSDKTLYKDMLNGVYSVIKYLTPEYQKQYISKHRNHFVKTANAATATNKILLENNDYELVVEIFKDYLPNFNKDDDSNTDISHCAYNIAKALHCSITSKKLYRTHKRLIGFCQMTQIF